MDIFVMKAKEMSIHGMTAASIRHLHRPGCRPYVCSGCLTTAVSDRSEVSGMFNLFFLVLIYSCGCSTIQESSLQKIGTQNILTGFLNKILILRDNAGFIRNTSLKRRVVIGNYYINKQCCNVLKTSLKKKKKKARWNIEHTLTGDVIKTLSFWSGKRGSPRLLCSFGVHLLTW